MNCALLKLILYKIFLGRLEDNFCNMFESIKDILLISIFSLLNCKYRISLLMAKWQICQFLAHRQDLQSKIKRKGLCRKQSRELQSFKASMSWNYPLAFLFKYCRRFLLWLIFHHLKEVGIFDIEERYTLSLFATLTW